MKSCYRISRAVYPQVPKAFETAVERTKYSPAWKQEAVIPALKSGMVCAFETATEQATKPGSLCGSGVARPVGLQCKHRLPYLRVSLILAEFSLARCEAMAGEKRRHTAVPAIYVV